VSRKKKKKKKKKKKGRKGPGLLRFRPFLLRRC
jgi:hypothetical protein